MTPVDAILTHFPPVEGAEPGGGRLDDEARRLREMFAQATSASLLLFNEPLTSTGEREALILASDILRALRLLNARTVYVTHLHALADELDTLNHAGDGATIVSWVAGVDETTARTYHIQPGRPAARSHATLIAQQHNITFEQLARQLAERGIGVASPGAAPTTESRTPGRS
jgi:DNA mismatch repair ATPase MutS